MQYKKQRGFTLIELLVVVLIIGILAAVALPQYNKAVEKSRLTEALQNVKIIERNMELFNLENPSGTEASLKDLGEAGEIAQNCKNFYYSAFVDAGYVFHYEVYRNTNLSPSSGTCPLPSDGYLYALIGHSDNVPVWDRRECYTWKTDVGRRMCESLKSQGFTYYDYGL